MFGSHPFVWACSWLGPLLGTPHPSSRHTVPPVDVEGANVWESFSVCMALVTFTDGFATSMVVVHCNNTSCVAWVSGVMLSQPQPVPLFKRLLALCVQLRIRLLVVPIEGSANVLADAVCRQQWAKFGPAAAAAIQCQSPYLLWVLPSLQASA